MGALVDDNSPGFTELSGVLKYGFKSERGCAQEVVQDDTNALKPNCRAQHCAMAGLHGHAIKKKDHNRSNEFKKEWDPKDD